MTIPKKIKISGYEYKVIECKNDARDENRNGWHNSSTYEIGIDPDLPEQVKSSTFLHEIIEAINCHNELGLEHNKVMILENCLYQVLKDNKLRF
jgi:hypothetical protein